MKKAGYALLAVWIVIASTLSGAISVAAAPALDIVSSSAILMDADTGEVLYGKNISQKMYPASITKILTGLLAMEICHSDELISVSASAIKIPRGYAHIALTAGDKISVGNAMYATMLASANDAANALAEHVGGTQEEFADLMNKRAEEIGTQNSNFVNASGIPSKNHYTTAYDMALITREASQNEALMCYFGASSYILPAFNTQTQETEIINYQFMLQEDKEEYSPDVIGGKIGYTGQAGHTMSTVAQRNGRTLICVVLGSTRNGKYSDTQMLLDYGFDM